MENLPWTPPSPATLGVFVGIVFVVVGALVALVAAGRTPSRAGRMAGGLAIWLVLTGLIPFSGLFSLGPPALVGLLVVINGGVLGTAFSPVGRWLVGAPLWALVGFQAFRLPLEMVLHAWGDQGVIPISMTWSGQNLDVFAGITALVAAPVVAFAGPSMARGAAWIANVVGFVLLLNVMRVAVQSAPTPFRIFGDPALVLPLHFPTIWIVSICVAGALFVHLVTFRRLWRAKWAADTVAVVARAE